MSLDMSVCIVVSMYLPLPLRSACNVSCMCHVLVMLSCWVKYQDAETTNCAACSVFLVNWNCLFSMTHRGITPDRTATTNQTIGQRVAPRHNTPRQGHQGICGVMAPPTTAPLLSATSIRSSSAIIVLTRRGACDDGGLLRASSGHRHRLARSSARSQRHRRSSSRPGGKVNRRRRKASGSSRHRAGGGQLFAVDTRYRAVSGGHGPDESDNGVAGQACQAHHRAQSAGTRFTPGDGHGSCG